MPDLTPERRAALRAGIETTNLHWSATTIRNADLLALLDAADERDRLREALVATAKHYNLKGRSADAPV